MGSWVPVHKKSPKQNFFDFFGHLGPKRELIERDAYRKLLGHMFMSKLARDLPPNCVLIHAVCPGPVRDTGIWKSMKPRRLLFIFGTLPKGALTYIDAVAVRVMKISRQDLEEL
jgi:hypothetical protein